MGLSLIKGRVGSKRHYFPGRFYPSKYICTRYVNCGRQRSTSRSIRPSLLSTNETGVDLQLNHPFFFFLHVHTIERRKIRTSDHRFIRHNPNRLNYLLKTPVKPLEEEILAVCVAATQSVNKQEGWPSRILWVFPP